MRGLCEGRFYSRPEFSNFVKTIPYFLSHIESELNKDSAGKMCARGKKSLNFLWQATRISPPILGLTRCGNSADVFCTLSQNPLTP